MIHRLMTLCFLFTTIGCFAQTEVPDNDHRLGAFDRVVVAGGGNVSISYSDQHTIRIDADDHCIQSMKFHVQSGTLYIEPRPAVSKRDDCRHAIYIGVPVLRELILSGGGDVVVREGFSRATNFKCNVSGGGNVDVSNLPVDFFTASMSGGGKISLNANNGLTANISGGGIIEYSGNPKIEKHFSGGGLLRKR